MKNCVMYKGFAILGLIFLFTLGLISVLKPNIVLNDTIINAFTIIIVASLSLASFSNIYIKWNGNEIKTTGKRTVWTEAERAERLAKKA